MTGHLLGGAGAVEAIACILSIIHNKVPPTINTKEVEPEYAGRLNISIGKAVPKQVTYAMSNTFGFGGHIACSVYKKFEE
jgi:3-oxoacyl-[acyl-carrier-protein] synthase II